MSQTPVEVKKEPEDVPSEDEEVQKPGPDGDPDPGHVDKVTIKQEPNPDPVIQIKQEIKQEIKEEPKSEDYQKLLDYGLDMRVATRLDEIYITGKLTHEDLDERALDALKEFPIDGALAVLAQFMDANLEHVSNKSAYLCGVMKTYRQKSRSGTSSTVSTAGSNSGLLNGTNGSSLAGANSGSNGLQVSKGPDEDKIKQILERTGYTLDVTTGQRKYGGPPPKWESEAPGSGCEIFCGKIPRDMYEDELIPLFEQCGTIWDLRLMMDPMNGLNRGYAFVTFTDREAASSAVRKFNGHMIREGKDLKINISDPKTRLFIGNIPKTKGREEIEEEFQKLGAGLKEVIIYCSPDDKKKNRGFCFLEYESHKAASLAKRRLETGRIKVWNCDIIVDWADPQEEPDAETMAQVKVLYVRNLTSSVTEEKLRETFEHYGKVERVKKIKDYAFIHFDDREHAENAMNSLNKTEVGGSDIEISLAKPPSDKKKKEEILRKREQRMMKSMAHHSMTLPPFPPFPPAFGHMGGPGGVPAAGPMYCANGGVNKAGGGGAPMGMRGYNNAWLWSSRDTNWGGGHHGHQGHHGHHQKKKFLH